MTDRYRVTAPYVTLRTDTVQGVTLLGFYKDSVLPESVNLEDLARHIRKNMVEKIEGAEAKVVDQQQAEADKAAAAAEAATAEADKEGEAAVKQAEVDKAAADKAAAKAGTPPVKATDSKPGSKTAQAG